MLLDAIVKSPSKSLASCLLLFCVGILIGPFVLSVSVSMQISLIVLSILWFIFSSTKQDQVLCLYAFAFLLGVFRYGQSEIPKNLPTMRDRIGETVMMEGRVSAEPSHRATSQQIIIDSVRVENKPVFGKLLISVPKDETVSYDDRFSFSCSLQMPRPFDGFAYDRYLQAKGVLALCRFPNDLKIVASNHTSFIRSILVFKQGIVEKMKAIFPPPHASFLFGLVFGGSVGLDQDVKEEFKKTGMSHILAASGFNVSLFTFVFFGFVIQYLGKKRGVIATGLLLAIYVVIAGFSPAVVRAAVFGAVLLVGSMIGRRVSILNTLLLTASLMLFYNPRWLLDDVGFQLSFVAFASILFLAPKLDKRLSFITDRFGIRNALSGSLSAILFTLPIILWQFGSVSLVAPFANVFVLPLIPFLMFSTIAILPIAWISTTLASVIALPVLWGSQYVLTIISIFASPSFASVSVPFARTFAVVIALVILIIAFLRRA